MSVLVDLRSLKESVRAQPRREDVWIQAVYFINASFVFFNNHILKYCGENLSHWFSCSHRRRDLLSLCSAPTASAHYLIFSTHARPSRHFHVIECFWGGRALMQRALYSHTVSCLVNTALSARGLKSPPKNHRPQRKCCFSWRLRSQQSITQTTAGSDSRSHRRFITQLSSVWSFIPCTDHLYRWYSFGQISLCVDVSGCNV